MDSEDRPDRFKAGRRFDLARKRLLGMPVDALAVRVGPFVLEEGRLAGYGWELFGCFPDDAGDREWPAYRLGFGSSGSTPNREWVQVWQQLVRCPGTKAYVEMRWNPDDGRTIALRGLEQEPSLTEAKRALKGLKVLRPSMRAGRPVGSGTFANSDEFTRELQEVVQRLGTSACGSLRR